MQRYIQVFSLITLALLGAGASFLTSGYVTSSAGTAAIGAVLIEGALAPLLISAVLALVAARQNRQRGWFAALLAILIVGGLAPYAMFVVFVGLANGDRAILHAQFGLASLLIETLSPLVVALACLLYSFQANRFKAAWDRPSVVR
jgi:ACR3 family arsenite efflux pump ArsB